MTARRTLAMAMALAVAGPASLAAAQAVITTPDWVHKPNGADLRAVWPIKLRGVGEARIRCRVTLSGALDSCAVVSESPAGVGVGAAALLLTPNFLMRPATKDGQPVYATVSIPIRFDGGGGVAAGGQRVLSIVSPVWIKAPSAAQVAAAAPRGVTGHAAIRCEARRDGSLHECQALSEEPRQRGLGAAARKLAPFFQLLTDPAGPPDSAPVQVTVPVDFPAPDAATRYLSAPTWRSRPTPSQATSIFPDKAAHDGLKTGRAILDCALRPDGAFGDCVIESEDPPGEGFGEAARRLVTVMAVSPWTSDGRAVDGAHVRVPVRLSLGDGAAK